MKKRHMLLAVLLGILGELIIFFAIAIPIALIFNSSNIVFVVLCFSVLAGGLISSSLIKKHGWIFALLVNFIWVISLIAYFIGKIYLIDMGNAHIEENLFVIIIIIISGIVGEKYSIQIRKFLNNIFSWILISAALVSHLLGFVIYFYFIYLTGKEFFEYGRFWRGLLYFILIGPAAGYIIYFVTLGIASLIGWFNEKINNIYPINDDIDHDFIIVENDSSNEINNY